MYTLTGKGSQTVARGRPCTFVFVVRVHRLGWVYCTCCTPKFHADGIEKASFVQIGNTTRNCDNFKENVKVFK